MDMWKFRLFLKQSFNNKMYSLIGNLKEYFELQLRCCLSFEVKQKFSYKSLLNHG